MLLIILGIIILIIVISIYQKTSKIQEDVMALRRHFDLMTPQELEEEDIEKQLRKHRKLNQAELDQINEDIEKELESHKDK